MLIRYTDFSLSHALDKYLNILLNLRCTLIYRVFIIKITAIISVSKKIKILYILKIPLSSRYMNGCVVAKRVTLGAPLEQISPKKNEYSVILSFKHDRQNKVSNR